MTRMCTTDAARLDRRQFMVGAAGLTFAVALAGPQAAAAATEKAMSPWVSIATDGTIAIMSPATEMGQGSMTSLPLILAEELDADWSMVRIVPAPPVDKLYGNPGFGHVMYTAGSSAVTGYFKALRQFGAEVRRVLMNNAARHWGVTVDELSTEPSTVVHAKSGRRLGYGEIAAFAEVPAQAPEVKPEQLKRPSEFRLIGKDAMRIELPGKVNGSAFYSIDAQVPGMLYGAIRRAPVEGSAPERVDDAQARGVQGVVDIVRLPYGVGVLARTPWAAFAAKEALKVEWRRDGAGWGFDSDKALEAYAAAARDVATAGAPWDKKGDPATAMKDAVSVVEGEYFCDFAYHAQMEPLNAVASVSPGGDAVELWCGTQSQTMAVAAAAKALGIAPERVKLHDTLLGGGFGRRGHRDEEFIVDAVLLSKAAGKPVKVLWTREDDVRNGRFRPMTAHVLRAGLDASGRVLAWQHRVASENVTQFQDPVRFAATGKRDFIGMRGTELTIYDIPHRLIEQLPQESGMRTSSLRGIGFGNNKFATEAFLDEARHGSGGAPP
jgi:isoquinoline 1-oxidoreductase subunit beta